MRVLVVNAGSSSLKLAVLDDDGSLRATTTVQRWRGDGDLQPLRDFLARCGPVDAVGHRIVHGGPRHREPVVVDDVLVAYLYSISDLAPLHQSRALAGVRAVQEMLPHVPAVACFDTGFHATMPAAATTYPLPADWNQRWGLRRYGFHGLSHAYAARRGAELVGREAADLRIITCHLGAGASMAAVVDGVAVDTTMGFTPLAGLVMNTRPGTLDPGLVLWLLQHGGIPLTELVDVLEHHSGLKGLSGTDGDVRDVLAGRVSGDPACVLAFDVYRHRLAREAAALTASTGGLDLLVLTGGVGEHSWEVRQALADGLAHLGVALDPGRNRTTTTDADISVPGAGVRTVVVNAREDLEIGRHVIDVLTSG